MSAKIKNQFHFTAFFTILRWVKCQTKNTFIWKRAFTLALKTMKVTENGEGKVVIREVGTNIVSNEIAYNVTGIDKSSPIITIDGIGEDVKVKANTYKCGALGLQTCYKDVVTVKYNIDMVHNLYQG